MEIMDAHVHAFPDHVARRALPKLRSEAVWFELRPSYDGTVAGLLASMDRANIRRAIVCSVATRPEQTAKITEWSAGIASQRLIPLASVHPDSPAPEAEVERIASAGLKGLKFHPYYMGCALDDPRTVRIARAAARSGLAMVFHAGYDFGFERSDMASPRRLRRLHEAVPDLRMAGCHLGGWEQWAEAIEEVAALPIYLETSFTVGRCPQELLLRLIEKHPPERLLFGTDAPWTNQGEELARFLSLPLGEKFRRSALWSNAHRFLGIPVPQAEDSAG